MTQRANIFLSSGIFWFWDKPWWEHLELLSQVSKIDGVQILCSAEDLSVPLPPSAVSKYLSERYEIILHPFFSNIFNWHQNSAVIKRLNNINLWANKAGVKRVIFHCDLFQSNTSKLLLLKNIFNGKKFLIENTGKMDSYGNRLEHLIRFLSLSEEVYLAIDMAHLSETNYLDFDGWFNNKLICERLDCIHISSSNRNNNQNRINVPEEISRANHIPAFLKMENIDIPYRTLLVKYPLIMEGCLPKGVLGKKFLLKEIEFLNNWASNIKEN